jgi:hypothetical protein
MLDLRRSLRVTVVRLLRTFFVADYLPIEDARVALGNQEVEMREHVGEQDVALADEMISVKAARAHRFDELPARTWSRAELREDLARSLVLEF